MLLFFFSTFEKIKNTNPLSPGEIVFLDRAIPDALAYYRFLNLPEDKMLLDALRTVSYKKVFILEYLPLVHDYARTQDEAAQQNPFLIFLSGTSSAFIFFMLSALRKLYLKAY